jgi:hypothetical protein
MKWISVKKQLPKEGRTVLVQTISWPNLWNKPEILMGECFPKRNANDRNNIWRVVDIWGEYNKPYQFVPDECITYWRELPKTTENEETESNK